MFKNSTFAAASSAGLLVNASFYGLMFILSLYFQSQLGLSALRTGLAFVPMTAAVLVANLMAPRLIDSVGARKLIAFAAVLMAIACAALLGVRRDSSYGSMVGQLILLGGGLGLMVPPLTSALLGCVDKGRSGLASGVLNSARQIGSVIGVALFGSFVSRSGAFMAGTRIVLALSTGLLIAACVVAWKGIGPRDRAT